MHHMDKKTLVKWNTNVQRFIIFTGDMGVRAFRADGLQRTRPREALVRTGPVRRRPDRAHPVAALSRKVV